MKRVFGRAALTVAAVGGALGAFSACTDEQTGFVIMGNIATTPPACIARADANVTTYLEGVLDVGLTLQYRATLLVGNQLTPRGDKPNLRTETQITTITGAEVSLYRDDGSLERSFTVPAAGVISPEEADEPGFGIVGVTLIPAQAGFDLATELTDRAERRTRVVEAKVFGNTLGGNEVESSPFTYVISVCEGCLVAFDDEVLDPMGNCRMTTEDKPTEPCKFGQDEKVDCRLCRLNNPLCLSP